MAAGRFMIIPPGNNRYVVVAAFAVNGTHSNIPRYADDGICRTSTDTSRTHDRRLCFFDAKQCSSAYRP
jgi:hypothetical protein